MLYADIVAALAGADEDDVERYRVAAFPVWFESGKKGQTFGAFLRKIGLGYKTGKGAQSLKPSPEKIREIYAMADRIRAMDKGAKNV